VVIEISLTISKWLGKQLVYENSQIEVLAYGMQIILESLCEIVLIFLLSLILGISKTTIVTFFTYALFRSLGGGAHLSTFLRCLTTGVVFMLGIGSISMVIIPDKLFFLLLTLTGALALICIIFWVPAGTEKKQINDPVVRTRQKMKFTILLIIWTVLAVYFYQSKFAEIYQQSLVYGALMALFFITPAGYKLMDKIDHGLNTLARKEVLFDEG